MNQLVNLDSEPRALHSEPPALSLASQSIPSQTSPFMAYIGAFPSQQSQRTMTGALEAVAALFGPQYNAANFPWEELRVEHTQRIRALLIEKHKPRTVNKHLSAVRGVLNFAESMELMTADQLRRALQNFKNIEPSGELRGRALTLTEQEKIFNACNDGTALGIRDAALFALLYMAGMARRSEVVAFDMSDYDAETGRIQIRHGKGNKYRYDFIGPAKPAVEAWLVIRPDCEGPLLLPVAKGGIIEMRRLTDQAVYKALQARADKAGVIRFTPHDVRRTAISDYLDNGVDITTVAKKAGHASVEQTARYDRRGERAIEQGSTRMTLPYLGGVK